MRHVATDLINPCIPSNSTDVSTPSSKQRIAIIGGGPSALTAAFWLTSTPELRERYELTIYQMGWRLGGKGASGRNRQQADRIEEHGLHIMFGFYQNFFAMIRAVYRELGRPPGAPLATWREAFHPHSSGVMEDKFHGRWEPWIIPFPRNHEVPGAGAALNGPVEYLLMLLQALIGLLFGWRTQLAFADIIFPTGRRWEQDDAAGAPEESWVTQCLIGLLDTFLALCNWIDRHFPWFTSLLGKGYELFWWCLQGPVRHSSRANRFWTGIDCGVACFRGVVRDRLYRPGGYENIDHWDFRDWLNHHGAHQETLHSPYVRMIYDAAFSYADGRSSRMLISAPVALRTIIRMIISYKGAMYYKMMCGMGDTIFAPLYEVLKSRGVKFHFFHKASAIHLNADATAVAAVDFEIQAETLDADPQNYAPLFDCRGLPSWPAEPLYDQLRDPEKLRPIDLESYYSGYAGVGTLTLEAGRDFDTLLLGTPVQCLPFLCKDLHRWNNSWRQMVSGVKAVQTLSFQIWLSCSSEDLGWDGPAEPLLSLYVEPLNTWSDMSQVLDRESWTTVPTPGSVQYFTGAQDGPDSPPLPVEQNLDFPLINKEHAKDAALRYLEKNFTTLVPKATSSEASSSIDWSLLVSLQECPNGPERFDTQYWRSNCEPHERCTVALPGTAQYRLKAGETGYGNLIITGDWIDNGIQVACLEGAVMGGIYSARAIAGIRFPIIGEMLSHSFLGRSDS